MTLDPILFSCYIPLFQSFLVLHLYIFFMLSCMNICQTSGNSEIEKIQQKNDEVLHEVEDLKV